MIFNRPLPLLFSLLFSYSMSLFALQDLSETSDEHFEEKIQIDSHNLYAVSSIRLRHFNLVSRIKKKNDDSRKGGYFPPIDFDDKIVNFFFQAFYYIKIRQKDVLFVFITRVYDNFSNSFQQSRLEEVSIKIFDRFQSNI